MALTTVPASLSATALTLTTAAQPNITSLGTLTGLTVSGNIAGTLTTAAQTNITSVGTLTGLTVSGNIAGTLTTAAQTNITSLGTLTGLTSSGNVGIGAGASDGNLHIRKTGISTGITNVLINANFADGSNGSGLSIGYRTDETTAVLAPRTATGNIAFYAYNNSAWFEAMRMTTAGKFGIGTSTINSDSLLHLKSTQPNIYFEDTDDSKSWRLEAGSVFKVQNITTSTEAFRVKQNGAFGIGTAPTDFFDVLGSVSTYDIGTDNSAEVVANFVPDSSSNRNGRFRIAGTTTPSNHSVALISDSSTNVGMTFVTTSGGSRTERMVIDSGGRVGIGTISPSAILEVASSAPTFILNADSQATNKKKIRLAASQYTAGDFNIQQMNDDGTTIALTAMTIKNGGNVGIGTTNPNVALDIYGANNTTFAAASAGTPANLFITGTNAYDSGYAGAGILFAGKYNSSNSYTTFGVVSGIKESTTDGVYGGALTFMTREHGAGAGNQERMRITSTGRVGINNDSPSAQLTITDENAGQAVIHARNFATSATGSFVNQHAYEFRAATSTTTHGMLVALNENNIGRRSLEVADSTGIFATFVQGRLGIGTQSPGYNLNVVSSGVASRFEGGNGGYSALTWTGDNTNTIGSMTTWASRIWIGSQNSGATGSNGEIVIKPGTSTSSGGVGTTLGRTPDVSLEVGGPLKIVNNTAGGISQTHTNMSVANSGKLLINFASIGTMTSGDTIVFTYAAISWKSWFFKIRWSSTGGYIGELWAGGYNNNSDGAGVFNPKYRHTDHTGNVGTATTDGASLAVTRSGQGNTMTLTLNHTHVHPLFEIEYACGGGEGYPQASRASITVNS